MASSPPSPRPPAPAPERTVATVVCAALARLLTAVFLFFGGGDSFDTGGGSRCCADREACKELEPSFVTGQLLGLDIGSTLEITYAFHPLEDEAEEDDGSSFQLEMMRCLREVNVDNNTVGWYQSTFVGSYRTLGLWVPCPTKSIKRCVCVVCDPQGRRKAFGRRF